MLEGAPAKRTFPKSVPIRITPKEFQSARGRRGLAAETAGYRSEASECSAHDAPILSPR